MSRDAEPTTGPQPREGVLQLRPYMRGLGRIDGHERVHKLSSNESPLGPSPAAQAAVVAEAPTLHRYPEAGHGSLREAIAMRFGLDADRIICGPGSDALLNLLAQAYAGPGDEIVYSAHGFMRFRIYAVAAGAQPVAAPDTDFRTDIDAILAAVGARTRLVMLANPDNPTGTYLSADAIERLHAALPKHTVLVLDAAYADYSEAADYNAGAGLVERAGNVVMARTFSKIFGLAGARAGWLYAPPAIIDTLHRVELSFPLAAPTIAAAEAALTDEAHYQAGQAHNRRWRPWLAARLTELGLHVYPSEGNFLLVQFDDPEHSAEAANQHLLTRGILARMFTAGDLGRCLRVTVGPEDALRACVSALAEFLQT